mgnify:CR=1 FL=1
MTEVKVEQVSADLMMTNETPVVVLVVICFYCGRSACRLLHMMMIETAVAENIDNVDNDERFREQTVLPGA